MNGIYQSFNTIKNSNPQISEDSTQLGLAP